jgi:orotidine-5'-phosphate decarboxylase
MTFIELLGRAWQQNNSLLCVGLDPDPLRYPAHLGQHHDRVFEFCKAIVDATAPYACAFKPQIAYFAAQAQEPALKQLIDYIHVQYPGIPVILDAKRGDIGATAAQYAQEAFVRYGADALTVNPYMGADSLDPYFAFSNKGVILLCRTSNPGGSDLQALSVNPSNQGSKPLYQHIAHQAKHHWNKTGQLALVVGATFAEEIGQVRQIVGDMPLLVPGIGAQGGDLEATVNQGLDQNLNGMMISSSRAILYASKEADFAQAAARVAMETRDAINQVRFRA